MKERLKDIFLIMIIPVLFAIVFYYGIQGEQQEDKKYLSNPQKYCIDNYGDITTKNIPAKCLKYFNLIIN